MSLHPCELRCEQRTDPIDIIAQQPRLSWQLQSDGPGGRQTAYQVQVRRSRSFSGRGTSCLWDSGRRDGDSSMLVPYEKEPLRSGMRCWWRVRAWDERGQIGPFSAPAFWEMGPAAADDWGRAEWIAMPDPEEWVSISSTQPEPSPLLRKASSVRRTGDRARVCICGIAPGRTDVTAYSSQ